MVRELKWIGMRKEVPKSEGVSMLMEVEKIVKEKSRKKSQELIKRKEKSETEGGLSMRRRGSSSTVGEHL